jgi:outer membrane protein assembly factor BamE (lipoprotein component of BamABCDE complex)
MRFLFSRLVTPVLFVATVSACAPNIDVRGSQISPEVLAEITPGRNTRSDVVALLGTPATTAPFSDDSWYYVGGKIERWAFFKPEELERQVVEIDFDKDGKVKNIRQLGLQDGRQIDIATAETPTAGKDLTVLEQLLGNVGKFNPVKGKSGSGGGGPGGGM